MNLRKKYNDFLDEISSEEIFQGLLEYGLFADKLPPIFTGASFGDYCQKAQPHFDKKRKRGYVHYETMRNNNVPRFLGIPHPGGHYLLCRQIEENWLKLQEYFKRQTRDWEHIVSLIHLRKTEGNKSLFKMNYKNWRTDGTPESELLFYKNKDNKLCSAKFLVCADISNCFPSIYTHSFAWALEIKGKNEVKKNLNNKKKEKPWYDDLDLCARNTKLGETHGILIGPHTSNLLAEIILVAVDAELYKKGWRYVRNIDDYDCYVTTRDEAQLFLTELGDELRKYGLALNHKKTTIFELPQATLENWARKLNLFHAIYCKNTINFLEIRAYLDFAIELMEKNNGNAAVLNYAIKTLATKRLSHNAKIYYIRAVLHLATIYPYLVSLLDEYVFEPFMVSNLQIAAFSNLIFEEKVALKQYEAGCYALYFAVKYQFKIDKIAADIAIKSNDCLFLLLSFLYLQANGKEDDVEVLKDYARELMTTEMDEFWIFVYEVASIEDLENARKTIREMEGCFNEWKQMKKEGVTFLKKIFDFKRVDNKRNDKALV